MGKFHASTIRSVVHMFLGDVKTWNLSKLAANEDVQKVII